MGLHPAERLRLCSRRSRSRSLCARFLTFSADQGAVGGAVPRDSILKYLPFASSDEMSAGNVRVYPSK